MKVSTENSKLRKRMHCKQGVVVCEKLPGRFPDAIEYRPSSRLCMRKKAQDASLVGTCQKVMWTCV